ncbi:MAG: AMMECR1 domain-containing protein, partial [Candidatus Omnitrophica bacterium]|nr:AMMECR1 domain-containing protein [Candidatus Omnitrophota bacterium]
MKGKFRIIVYLIFILSFLFNPFSAICKEASPPHYEICAVKYGDSYRVEKDPTESGEDKRIPFAWIFWVIRRANKIILVDTGFNNETLKEKWQISNFRQMDTLLEKLGIEPANITDIIITHSHWDHIGNLAAFPGADIWMQKKEYDFARSTVSDSRPHYKGVRLEDVKELVEAEKEGRLHLIKGDKEIFPGISVYLAGGHTPGIQFVSLETKTGRIILASDTFYLYKDMPLQTQTGYTKTSPKSNRLFKRMEKIAVSPERIIPGHDPAVFKRFKSITEGIVDMTSPLSANEIDESQSGIDFIKFPDSIKVGKEYEIIMHLVNEGPSSSGAKGAFCGLHVEVENAAVKNVLGYSAFTKARETRVMKAGNIRWFETIYNRLKEGDKGAVRFHIIPKKLPVKFYYRGWIPTSVPEEKKAEAIRDLKDRFKADGTWRHEKYIKRIPASDDASAPLCKIIVRAGHEKKQYYRCLFKEIPDSGTIPKTVTVKEAGDRIKATIKELRKLSPEEKRLLLGIARQTLKKTAEGEQMPRPADVPEGLAGYDNTVFVTVYKNGRIKGCMGSGRGDLMDATISASTSILSDKRFDVNLVRNPEQLEQLLIGINILARKEKVKSRSLKGIKGEVSLGIHGVEVKQGKRRALYKDSV